MLTCSDVLVRGELVTLTLASGGYAACTESIVADSTPDHILGVALEDVAAGATGRIGLKGIYSVSRHDTGDAGLAVVCGGAVGRVTAAPTTSAASGQPFVKVIGIATTAAAGAGDLVTVIFDGVSGFAASHS